MKLIACSRLGKQFSISTIKRALKLYMNSNNTKELYKIPFAKELIDGPYSQSDVFRTAYSAIHPNNKNKGLLSQSVKYSDDAIHKMFH